MHTPQALAGVAAQAARCRIHAGRHPRQTGLHRLQGDREEARQIGVDQRRHAAREQQAGVGAEPLQPSPRQPVIESRHRDQHADGDHRAGHGVAERDEAIDQTHCQCRRAPLCVGKRDRQQHGERGSHAGNQQAVASQNAKADVEATIPFRQCQSQEKAGRQQKAEGQRQQADQACQPGTIAVQAVPLAAPPTGVVKAGTAAADPLERQQAQDHGQQPGSQLGSGNPVTERKPGPVDARGECRYGEICNGAVVGQGFHQHQCNAGDHRRTHHGQRHRPKRRPWPQAKDARSLEGRAATFDEGGTDDQIDVRKKCAHEHRRSATQAADLREPVVVALPAEGIAQGRLHRSDELEQIGVHIGHDVSRQRQWQEQRPLEDAPPRKLGRRRQPGSGDADNRDPGADGQCQQQRVADILREHGGSQMAPCVSGGTDEEIRAHR